jgi:hypothetical protein
VIRGAIAGLLLLSASSASANDTGNDLYGWCQERPDSFRRGMCYGLITAYYEAVLTTYDCPTAEAPVTREQVVDVVMKFLREHPEERHIAAQWIANVALFQGFRCKKRPTTEK